MRLLGWLAFAILLPTAALAARLEVMPYTIEAAVSVGGTYEATIYIVDADGESTDFTWQLVPDRVWIQPETISGQGPAAVSVLITAEASQETMGFLSVYSSIGSTFVTVSREVWTAPPEEAGFPQLFPSQLFWSLERGSSKSAAVTDQKLHLYAPSPEGWSVTTDAPWLQVSSISWTSSTEGVGLLEGSLSVAPKVDLLLGLPPGRYEASVLVSREASQFFRLVPVVVEIREPGTTVTPPVAPPRFSQFSPELVRVEAVEGGWLELVLPASSPETVGLERVYLTVEIPDLRPGVVWSWRPTEGRFVPVEAGGVPVPGASDLYTALGPQEKIFFGPARLQGLTTSAVLGVRTGETYPSARILQRVELQIYTPHGSWQVTDQYEGESYRHPDELVFWREGSGWAACWQMDGACRVPVQVSYGDGKTCFYRLEFEEEGYWFEYQVTRLTATEMAGRWRFFDGEDWSAWESFSAARPVFGGLGGPFPPAF